VKQGRARCEGEDAAGERMQEKGRAWKMSRAQGRMVAGTQLWNRWHGKKARAEEGARRGPELLIQCRELGKHNPI
jgi:hypothetical protein